MHAVRKLFSHLSVMTATNQYVLPFGKYKSMYASDVALLTTVDKNGNDKNVGLIYLEWLTKQAWFRDTEIIKKIIEEAKTNMSDIEADDEPETEPEPPKKEKKPKTKSINIEHNKVLKF